MLYYSKVEKLRDQRMRGYYRERYDFKKNLMATPEGSILYYSIV